MNIFKGIFHYSRRKAAKYWIGVIKPYTIAITGSQGKTNTTYILSKLFPKANITDTDLDTIYNVPITALRIKKRRQIAIFELGIDKINEMDKHLDIIKPHIALITGISPVHADKKHLGSIENIIKEKRKLVEALSKDDIAVLNYDDKNVREMSAYTKAKIYYYGSDKDECNIYTDANINKYENYEITNKGMQFNIFDKDHKISIQTPLIGLHHISNIMACFIIFQLVKEEYFKDMQYIEEFKRILKGINPLKGRMSLSKGPLSSFILDDSLRANVSSVKSGLRSFSQMKGMDSKKIVILGEMGEIGDDETQKHKEIGRFIAELDDIDHVIGIGPLMKYTQEEAFNNGMGENKFYWAKDVMVAAGVLAMIIKEGDYIYLKSSLLKHIERIIMLLNGEDVNCSVISCPLYNHCSKCKYRASGYPS